MAETPLSRRVESIARAIASPEYLAADDILFLRGVYGRGGRLLPGQGRKLRRVLRSLAIQQNNPPFCSEASKATPLAPTVSPKVENTSAPTPDAKTAPVGPYGRESDDSYPVVAHLDDWHRVICCRDGIQWIVQRRMNNGGSGWRGMSFCRTREALIRDAKRRLGGAIPKDALAILRALPAMKGDW